MKMPIFQGVLIISHRCWRMQLCNPQWHRAGVLSRAMIHSLHSPPQESDIEWKPSHFCPYVSLVCWHEFGVMFHSEKDSNSCRCSFHLPKTFPKPRCIVLTLSAYTANLASFLVVNLWLKPKARQQNQLVSLLQWKLEICPILIAGLVVKDTCHMILFLWWSPRPQTWLELVIQRRQKEPCCPYVLYVLWGRATGGQPLPKHDKRCQRL